MHEDYKWFLDNYGDLYNQYGETFLAIKNKTVIGIYRTYAEGVKNTSRTEDIGTFIIQKCGKDDSSYTNYIASMNFMLS